MVDTSKDDFNHIQLMFRYVSILVFIKDYKPFFYYEVLKLMSIIPMVDGTHNYITGYVSNFKLYFFIVTNAR